MSGYPLTALQQHMLLATRVAGSTDYIDQVTCALGEPIDAARLQAAWQATMQRHPALRTGFRVEGSQDPVQEVQAPAGAPWIVEDWRQIAPAQRELRLAALADRERREPFVLERAPLSRFALVRCGDADWRLLWTFHHLLLDGRSVRLVLRDWFDAYDARPAAPPTARSFEAYVRQPPEQDAASASGFWRAQLGGFRTPNRITGMAEPGARGSDRAVRSVRLPAQLGGTLRQLAGEHDLTLNTLIQFAWAQVVGCHSGALDVVFGATRAARGPAADGFDETVGLLINTLPVRARLDSDQRLLAWLQEQRARWVALRAYERTPLPAVQRAAALPPAVPLFSTLFVYEHELLQSALQRLRPQWRGRGFRHRSGTAYPLTLAVFGEPEIRLRLGYARAEFDAALAGALLERVQIVLERLPAQLAQPVAAFSWLGDDERRQLLAIQDRRSWPPADAACVTALFERQVARTPLRPAVVADDEELSYAALNQRANRLGHELRARGVGANRVVGICLRRSADLVVSILATLKAGGAYLCLDPDYPAARLQQMLADARVTLLISRPETASAGFETVGDHLCLVRHATRIAGQPDANLPAVASGSDLAYVVFTSGSTGRPKGILVEQRGLANFARAMLERYRITPQDRRLQFASISSDVLIGDLFPWLIAGAAVVLRPAGQALGIRELLAFVALRQVTVVGLPSSFWHEWMAAWSEADLAFPDSLRLVLCGTERVRADRYAVWREKAPRRVRWFNVYGPSEATGVATLYEADPDASRLAASIPIGQPIPNVSVYVLDPALRLVPVGVVGELSIGGVGVGRGYLGQPGLTAQRFLPDPFADQPGARMYRTGDLVRRLPDASLEFVGRCDQQLQIRGYRVEPGEIECVLAEHPEVRACVVAGVAGATGDVRLCGFVVPATGSRADPASLRAWLAPRLPDHLVPSQIVLLPALPLSANGKVDRSALAAHLPVSGTTPGPEAPRTRLERRLVTAWSGWFGRDVGIDDDFFALGGDSLLAMKLFAWLDREHACALPLSTLLQRSTIRRLAAAAADRQPLAAGSAPLPIKASGTRPPLFSAHGMGNLLFLRDLGHALDPEQPLYGLEARGLLPGEAPHATLEAMAAHYVLGIRSVQPVGPYRLAGQCFGGVLAYAMAKELEALGETVDLLAILDSNAPHQRDAARVPRVAQRGSAWAALRSWGVRWLRSPRERRSHATAQHLRRLRAAYRTGPYAGKILLVRSSEFAGSSAKDHQLDDWRALARGGLTTEVIEARHATLLSPPAVQHTARVLEPHLRR